MRADAIITRPDPPASVADVKQQAKRWRDALEFVKPGAHVLVFAGRDADLLSFAMRLGGYDIRDAIGYAHAVEHSNAIGWAPIIVARVPLEGSVAANVMRHNTGAMNIDACRITVGDDGPKACTGTGWAAQDKKNAEHGYRAVAYYADQTGWDYTPHEAGRWPANVIHDGSDAVLAAFNAFGEKVSGKGGDGRQITRRATLGDTEAGWGMRHDTSAGVAFGDAGSAARFFHEARTDQMLYEYLLRLILPPGGTIIDPFPR
jgi:site-specific DNA-methyltransferase (adenine-specific)